MGVSTKVCSLILWCSVFSVKNVQSQGYYYKKSNVNQYQITNGKYELVTTTTPMPTALETFFPWLGTAYDSVRSPAEDAAILNSLSDLEGSSSNPAQATTESEGIFSWLPSMPSMPAMPAISIPGFGSSSEPAEEVKAAGTGSPTAFQNPMGPPPQAGYMVPPGPNMAYPPPNYMNGPSPNQGEYPPPGLMGGTGPPPAQMEYPYPGVMGGSPDFPPPGLMGFMEQPAPNSQLMGGPNPMNMYETFDTNGIAFQNGGMMTSASSNEPSVLFPPPEANMYMPSPQYSPMATPQHHPNAIPNEIRNNFNPTLQFHQSVRDSIPIPSPSLPSFSQPSPMLPYAYSASLQYGTNGATNERPLSPTFIDAISNFFNIGKRSDLDIKTVEELKKVMESRSDSPEEYYFTADIPGGIELKDWTAFVEKSSDSENETTDSAEDDSSQNEDTSDTSDSSPKSPDNKASSPELKEFPCPKNGIWRWNGEVCIAVGPIPVWACKPNDLIVSGKIAICRNKIYFSPKVINKNLVLPA